MSIDNLIKKIDIKKVHYPGTRYTLEFVLKSEINRLQKIILRHINDYYSSYHSWYDKHIGRSYALLNSFTIDDVCEVSANNMKITCKLLVNDNAIHTSHFSGQKINQLWNLNDGWKVKKNVWFKDIYRFGHYEGAHFIEDAIDEFKKTSKYPAIKLEVIRPLKYY